MATNLPASENSVYSPFRYILELPAKRVRPLLCLLTSALYGPLNEDVFHSALSVEVFHNFSLIHDDIMDEANLRRGQQAAHIKFSTNNAMLSGDIMLLYSIRILSNISSSATRDMAIQRFTETGIKICEGQQLDLEFESREEVFPNEYLKMIRYKTAILLGLSMYLGALTGKATADECERCYTLGLNTGIAFQLQDDILDLYGDPTEVGKKTGGDILQNKKTILYVLAMENLRPGKRESLCQLFREKRIQPDEKIDQVAALFEEADVRSKAEAMQMQYREEADTILSSLNGNPEKKSFLAEFLDTLSRRSR